MRLAPRVLALAVLFLPGVAGALDFTPYVAYNSMAEADCGDAASAPGYGLRLGGGGASTQLGVFFATTSVSGDDCNTDIDFTDFGGYMNFVLSDDPTAPGVYGAGIEAAYTSCTIDSPPGVDLDLCTGGWVGANLFYNRKLSVSDTGFTGSDGNWYPDRFIYLVFAVGYRGGSVSYDNTLTGDTEDASTSGPYATLGLKFIFNLRPKKND